MLSPSIKQSSSLKSLTDSQINTDMSDLQQNQQKHQQTVRRFSILSGIEQELNKKLDQKPLGINSIIMEEDQEQSIKKSKENQDFYNRVQSTNTVSDYSLNTHTHTTHSNNNLTNSNYSGNLNLNSLMSPSVNSHSNFHSNISYRQQSLMNISNKPQLTSTLRYKSNQLFNEKKPFYQHESHPIKQVPMVKQPKARFYKVTKTINLLNPAPPVIHHQKAFYKPQIMQDSFEQGELFGAALSTQRRQLSQINKL